MNTDVNFRIVYLKVKLDFSTALEPIKPFLTNHLLKKRQQIIQTCSLSLYSISHQEFAIIWSWPTCCLIQWWTWMVIHSAPLIPHRYTTVVSKVWYDMVLTHLFCNLGKKILFLFQDYKWINGTIDKTLKHSSSSYLLNLKNHIVLILLFVRM